MWSTLWSILVCKIPQFLAKSYRFRQLITLFQKVDTLSQLNIFITFCPPAGAKYPLFQALAHWLGRLSPDILFTTSTHSTDTLTLTRLLSQRAYLCAQLVAGLEPGTFEPQNSLFLHLHWQLMLLGECLKLGQHLEIFLVSY